MVDEDWIAAHCHRVTDGLEDTSILYALSPPPASLGHISLSPNVSVTVHGEEYTLQQRPEHLKGTTGATGSVLWRSSVVILDHLLRKSCFPPPADPAPTTGGKARGFTNERRENGEKAMRCGGVVLELGSGIGLAPCVLAARTELFIATDHDPALLRLIRKNSDSQTTMAMAAKGKGKGGRVVVMPLDWNDAAGTVTSSLRACLREAGRETVGTILCLDCVYSPHLASRLLRTLVALLDAFPAAVVILGQQLREESLHAEFVDDLCAAFSVFRVSADREGDSVQDVDGLGGYAIYVIRRTT